MNQSPLSLTATSPLPTAEERVHQKSITQLTAFKTRLSRISISPTMSDTPAINDADKEGTDSVVYPKMRRGSSIEQFQKPEYAATGTPQKSGGREVREEAGEEYEEEPTSFLAAVTGERKRREVEAIQRLSSNEPIAFKDNGGRDKPHMQPVLVKEGAGTLLPEEGRGSPNAKETEQLRESLRRTSIALEGEQTKKEELQQTLDDVVAKTEAQKEAIEAYIGEEIKPHYERALEYDGLCRRLVPEEEPSPAVLGNFIATYMEQAEARIEAADAKAAKLQESIEQLTRQTKETIAVLPSIQEMVEKMRVLNEQIAVRDEQIFSLERQIQAKGLALEGEEEEDPALRFMHEVVQELQALDAAQQARMAQLREDIDAERRQSI